jgi:hypothetical protein
VSQALFRHDPVGINFETNPDEYQTEAENNLAEAPACRSADDVLRVVHGEFVRWFDSATAGPEQHYREIAAEIWQLWQTHLNARR